MVGDLTPLSECEPAYCVTRNEAIDRRGHGVSVNERALTIRPAGFTDRDTQRLVAEVQAEYVRRYGGPDETPLEDGVFDPPRGAFFLGYLGEVPVAMGGWRLRDDVHPGGSRQAAEVKRMYVATAGRR